MIWLSCLCALCGFVTGGFFVGTIVIRKYLMELKSRKVFTERLQYIIRVYDVWMMMKREGKSVEKYLQEHGINSIAIYGMSELGNRLYQELKDSLIEIKYGMDMNAGIQLKDLRVIRPKDNDENVDAVVVTALTTFDDVKIGLRQKGYTNILALDEILYNL